MKRAGRKRLSVEIPLQLHNDLKKISIDNGCTVVVTVCRFLLEKVLEEKGINKSDFGGT